MTRESDQTYVAARLAPGWKVVCTVLLWLLPPAALGQSEGQEATRPSADRPEASASEADAADGAASPPTLADARDLLREGEYERAIGAFQTLALDPAYAKEAHVGLAISRMRIGKYEEAIAGLNEPGVRTSAEREYVLAQLYRITGRYEDVLKEARKAIALDANHAGARRLLGGTLELLGRRDEAIQAYRWFDRQLVEQDELPRDAEWITETALGFLRYSILTEETEKLPRRTQHVLQEMLQVAYERLDRTYWPARIAAADLLREKYNNDEEDGSVSDYLAALRINGSLCEAHVGLGEVALERWDFDEVERRADLALDVNPNHAPAIHLLAKKLIVERRYEQAIETCERALAINGRDLDALSIRAAAGACRYDEAEMARMRARVEIINPRCALFHRMLGDAWGGIRQYGRAEREYLQAIEYDPIDANARTELGLMYMQWGREAKARTVLEGAAELDPYNQRTIFTSKLLDSLAEFDRLETPHFIVKYDANRDPGLGGYFADYLEDVYGEVVGDYDTELKEKTIVELFPTQRTFAVRITGKPWIHTVGACTGRVIAVASPRKAEGLAGTYNLANVLKHEFTHTVTLAATDNRIPHWFTEGLAVYQEGGAHSFFWSGLLAEAARRDSLFTLESIDWAFMRPKRATDRQMAYAQSEWMCEYIIERFGYDVIGEMLDSFRGGQRQPQVFAELLGVAPEEFDRDFHTWAKKRVAGWGFDLTPPEDVTELRAAVLADFDNAKLFGRLARAEFDGEDYERALVAAIRALELDESERNGLEVLAKLLIKRAEEQMMESAREAYLDEAQPVLERLWDVDPRGWTAPKYLAEIALRREHWDRAMEPLKRLQRLCPLDPLSWRGLAGVYLERSEYDLALPQLLELARIEENDAEVRAQIARICRRRGRLREAQYWNRQALFIDPSSVELHKALGDVSMQAGDTESSLREYTMLTKLEPTNPKHFEDAAFAAHKLGDTKEAQRFAARAVELDPASPARSLVP
jgi:tetratricopeptide (TPR) repeat protein